MEVFVVTCDIKEKSNAASLHLLECVNHNLYGVRSAPPSIQLWNIYNYTFYSQRIIFFFYIFFYFE